MPSGRPSWDALFETAVAQQGLFTARQAADAGYSAQLLAHHVKARRMARVRRGIYRLVHFPAGGQENFVEAWLWSERVGVLSHATALFVYDLGDVLPARVNITLPAEWRTRRLRAPRDLVLHFADVSRKDWCWAAAVPVTTLGRTLLDCARDPLSRETIDKAMRDATRRGLVTREEIARVKACGRSRPA